MDSLSLNNIVLNLNVIGGHSFMLKSSDGKRLIKASTPKEIEFYEYTLTLDKNIYQFLPIFYGKITKNDSKFI